MQRRKHTPALRTFSADRHGASPNEQIPGRTLNSTDWCVSRRAWGEKLSHGVWRFGKVSRRRLSSGWNST